MSFPRPSEAFATVEVQSLVDAGAEVTVHALRAKHVLNNELLTALALPDVTVTHASLGSQLRNLALAARHPGRLLVVVGWLVRKGWRSPLLVLKSLALLPRILEIAAECESVRPDVIHAFWGHFPAIVLHICRRAADWPVVISTSLGAYDLTYAFGPGIDVARRADVVWTQAAANCEALRRLGIADDRIAVVIRGVSRLAASYACTNKIGGKIICVSRLEKSKGVDDCLRAFARASEQAVGSTLVIIGEGPDRRRLERLGRQLGVSDRVRFAGALPHAEVFGELADAAVFMLLSRSPSERLPNALKEAMALRCLCVVTESPGIRELLGALEVPQIVPQGDWREAGARLARLLIHSQDFAQERDRGREFVLGSLDAMRVAQTRIELWAKALARRVAVDSPISRDRMELQ